jgi:hypothetical protein
MPEQRHTNRYINHLPIEVWPSQSPEQKSKKDSKHHLDQLSNISMEGMAFESDVSWIQGTPVVIRVLDPPIECVGKVVWCRQDKKNFKVGVQLNEETCINHKELYRMCQTERIFEVIEILDQNIEFDNS